MVSAGLALGQAANLHRRRPGRGPAGWAARPLRDVDGLQSFAISHLPIIILSANDAQMAALCDRLPWSRPSAAGWRCFAYAQGIHDCHAYWERHRESAHRRLPMVGIWPARGAGSMDDGQPADAAVVCCPVGTSA